LGGESGARGYRSNWLAGLEGATSPMTSPPSRPSLPGQDGLAENTPSSQAHEQEPELGAALEPGQRSWAFDPPTAPGAKQDPVPGLGPHPAGHADAPAARESVFPSADRAASQLPEQAEPAMRSVWEPVTRHRPSTDRPGAEQNVEHPSPIARSSTWGSA